MASVAIAGRDLQYLKHLFNCGTAVGQTDGELLNRYTASNDQAAFAALLRAMGRWFWRPARAVLRSEQDIEDAFQATFLVLARKALGPDWRSGGGLAAPSCVPGRHSGEYRSGAKASTRVGRDDDGDSRDDSSRVEPDVSSIMHSEIDRLPDRYRIPVVLCDLEGLSHDEAATHLSWSVRSLRSRLSKARQRLRARLTRRGLGGVTLGVAMASSQGARSRSIGLGQGGGRGGNRRRQFASGDYALPGHHAQHAYRQAQECGGDRRGDYRNRVGRDWVSSISPVRRAERLRRNRWLALPLRS